MCFITIKSTLPESNYPIYLLGDYLTISTPKYTNFNGAKNISSFWYYFNGPKTIKKQPDVDKHKKSIKITNFQVINISSFQYYFNGPKLSSVNYKEVLTSKNYQSSIFLTLFTKTKNEKILIMVQKGGNCHNRSSESDAVIIMPNKDWKHECQNATFLRFYNARNIDSFLGKHADIMIQCILFLHYTGRVCSPNFISTCKLQIFRNKKNHQQKTNPYLSLSLP